MPASNLLGRLRSWILLSSVALLSGCKSAILDPKGQVGIDERNLLVTATVLMLLVVIPVIVMTLLFAWRYRASNKKARYEPNWSHSTAIEIVVWTIPCLIILVLGVLTWRSSHALDPYKPLQSDVKPVTIEAVSLDWKWLFIYPEQGIATVNEIAFPVDTPVNFKITSDSVMNSFFIPALGTQIYSMAGMETKLHLVANHIGDYPGISANYSGHGFSGMKFTAKATDPAAFDAWVAQVKTSQESLQAANYAELAKPSEKEPVRYYASVDPTLYQSIIDKYMMGGAKHGAHMNHEMPAAAGAHDAAAEGAHAGHEGHDMGAAQDTSSEKK
jgi:cytochrome o ubiquinol oxidase subunit II